MVAVQRTDTFFTVIHWWLSSREESHHGEARSGAGAALAFRADVVSPVGAEHLRILQTTQPGQAHARVLAALVRLRPTDEIPCPLAATFVTFTLVRTASEVALPTGLILRVPRTTDEEPIMCDG
jgi:hypothetical protein